MPFFAHNLIQVRLFASYAPNSDFASALTLGSLLTGCSCRDTFLCDIQVTRKWLNWEGEAVAQHFAALFSEMEADPRVQRALR